jgi:hypothetical protein
MWGRLATCAAVGYRRRSGDGARGTLWVGPIANRPQVANLPHKHYLAASVSEKPWPVPLTAVPNWCVRPIIGRSPGVLM